MSHAVYMRQLSVCMRQILTVIAVWGIISITSLPALKWMMMNQRLNEL